MIGSVSIFSIIKMKDERSAELKSTLEHNFDNSLKNEVNSVVTVLNGLYDKSYSGEITIQEAKIRGASVVRNMKYGENNSGYFWADMYDGTNIALAVRPEVEGTNRLNDQDLNGDFYIKEIISAGQKDGGGFSNYWFPKPGQTTQLEKRSYSLAFKPFGWVIGTGNYVEDIDKVVSASQKKVEDENQKTLTFMIIIGVIALIVTVALSFYIGIGISRPIIKVTDMADKMAQGNLTASVSASSKDEVGLLAKSLEKMRVNLQSLINQVEQHSWVKSNLAQITAELSGIQEVQTFTQTVLSKTVPLIGACQAAFFVNRFDKQNNEDVYKLLASYAYKKSNHSINTVRLGEGLVGQAALENTPILLENVPSDHIRVSSGLGESAPLNIYVLPVSFEGDVKGVIEFASFNKFSSVQQTFIEELMNNLGIMLDSIFGRMRLSDLLLESQMLAEELQAQAEELQSQQNELRATNEELEEQTQALKFSEEKLQDQQEKLELANSELREKAVILEAQNRQFEEFNKDLEHSRSEIEEKAMQLSLSYKYKSEFLANMSHELRTPLNSLLILSKLLSENKDGNLTVKQIQFSNTIYSSGQDLLTLINDILDLAKIESGKMDVNAISIQLKELVAAVEQVFRPVAAEKGLNFYTIYKDNLPSHIYSDGQRLQQVLKNLLSNAFKFTQNGEVKLEIGVDNNRSNHPMIFFSVIDTGIGIPENKLEQIFHAFQQADGTTSRKYGGTGLGLSICRELSLLLGGEIVVESIEGIGSKFTFYVGNYQNLNHKVEQLEMNDEVAVSFEKKNSRILDQKIPSTILDHSNKEKEMTINELGPAISIRPKSNIKRLLLVDDDLKQRNSLMELIGYKDVVIKAVSTGAEAIEELKVHQFDLAVLDLGPSDIKGFDLLDKMKLNPMNKNLKVIVYTGRSLTAKEEISLKRQGHTIIMKDSHSPQRLIDELEFYLNKSSEMLHVETKVTRESRQVNDLKGKKILLVDDDVRNVFAISNVLEPYGIQTVFAENGIEALEILNNHSERFDLVLMDIMMPEMDGYETIKRIREMEQFVDLPIITLTAKAMKEDRGRCIDAGASDYIVKPVDPDQLISLIRVWVFMGDRKEE
jgi:two-component system chemotaxis sensor kinase CheA